MKTLVIFSKGHLTTILGGINQILNAGGIDEVFSQLYLATKNNVAKHKDVWLGFLTKVQEEGHAYVDLKSLLIGDGLVEEEVAEEADDNVYSFLTKSKANQLTQTARNTVVLGTDIFLLIHGNCHAFRAAGYLKRSKIEDSLSTS